VRIIERNQRTILTGLDSLFGRVRFRLDVRFGGFADLVCAFA
jgi:hypothetical protein